MTRSRHGSAARRCQRGVAIIMVMLMVALAIIAVTAMVTGQRLDMYRTANRVVQTQARKLALAGERFAVQQLHKDRTEAARSNTDSFEDDWAISSPPFPVHGGTVAGCVVDLQGRFNLNSLVNDEGKVNDDERQYLRRLLEALDIEPLKSSAIVDWLDRDVNIIDADGAEDDHYSLQEPPYLAANRRMHGVSELKLIKGFNTEDDVEDYEALIPHISVLPAHTTLNINTATPPLIQALADFVTSAEAETLSRWDDESWEDYPVCPEFTAPGSATSTSTADRDPYENMTAFLDEINKNRTQADQSKFENTDLVSLDSQYYEVRIDIELGDSVLSQFSTLSRDDNGIVTVERRVRGDNPLQLR